MNQAAVIPPDTIESTDKFHARRTLAFAGTAHALHDGYTDMIYVLLPVSQTEFALGYKHPRDRTCALCRLPGSAPATALSA